MFQVREIDATLEPIREEYAPDAIVLDTSNFETLPESKAEELGLLVDSVDPVSYPESWLPDEPPALLREFVGDRFTIGMPGDGSVTWTRQTDPPIVLVKGRTDGSPEPFVRFLIAEAFVQIGTALPEHFIGFFEDQYTDLAAASPISPAETYQLAVALFDAYLGLFSRPVFTGWEDTHTELFEAWQNAGERLEPRLSELPREMATEGTRFSTAAEIGCSALKHDLDPPTPFSALDTAAYRETGPEYAVIWARKTFEKLQD